MSEIIFEVHEAEEGGFWARALGYAIFTQGEDWDDLRTMVKDAVTCHFEKEPERPRVIHVAL
jgi:predicted RNase H-like HicB family nuclease